MRSKPICTCPEGLTALQVVALVDHADALRGGLLRPPAEGSLLPQTYFYLYGDPRDALVSRMSLAMTQVLDSLWANRAPDLLITDKKQALDDIFWSLLNAKEFMFNH